MPDKDTAGVDVVLLLGGAVMITTLPVAAALYPEALQFVPTVEFVQLLMALATREATVLGDLLAVVVAERISLPATLIEET